MGEWEAISVAFRGWTLTEIKNLSPRERHNWIGRAAARRRT